nr:Ig-like domain repeat protein [uncultured bacterium]
MKKTNLKFGLVIALAAFVAGCGAGDPKITNTEVTPATWSVSGIADDVQFTLTTDVVNFGGDVTSVRADVVGTEKKFDLVKKEDIGAGERWTISTKLTLWNDLSSGTYPIRITATDSAGNTAVEEKAATVTVTD